MDRTRVKSSVIAALGYDGETHTLEVEFHTGRVYRYRRVPPSEYEALLQAESIGEHFNREIRPRYRYAEVKGTF